MERREALKLDLLKLLDSTRNRAAIERALKMLFPKISTLLEPNFQANKPDDFSRQRRISNTHFARSYFRLSPDNKIWRKSEIESAFSEGSPEHAFDVLKDRLAKSDDDAEHLIREVFIETVSEVLRDPQTDGRPWFSAIIVHIDSLIGEEHPGRVPFFGLSLADRTRVLLLRSLERVRAEEQVSVFSAQAEAAEDITLLCTLFRGIAGDKVEKGAAPAYTSVQWSSEDIERLRETLVARIRSLVAEQKFWVQGDPAHILWFWRNSGHETEVKEFLDSEMDTNEGLVALLDAMVTYVRSTAGDYETVNRESWSKMLDLDKLKSRAEVFRLLGSQHEKDLAARFLLAYERDLNESRW